MLFGSGIIGYMSIRRWLNIVTLLLIVILLVVSRHEIVQAWKLLTSVNVWILLLIIPAQALTYYSSGAMIFSYLKRKEKLRANSLETMKMSLELNFVNHILPSGGVSGASYMAWRLKHIGVGAGRATLAQAVRVVATFAAFLVLLLISLIVITLDGGINRLTILVTSGLASTIVFGTLFLMYVLNSRTRLSSFSRFLTNAVNKFGRKFLRRSVPLVKAETVAYFFTELHDDYLMLKKEPRLLIRPMLWGVVYNLAEVSLFLVAFWALGTPVNPAPLLIAFGLATVAGFFFVTPGGAGGYELVMIAFLASAGIDQGATVAAVLLARTLLIIGTIASGSIFYYVALEKHGKRSAER